MLPIVLTSTHRFAVIGSGPATEKRKKLLESAGAEFDYYDAPPVAVDADVIFIADYDDTISAELYARYKSDGTLINVEDKTDLCDFHVPALVRRGDLLLTVSTGAASPRLARRIRMALEQLFPASWAEHIATVKAKRNEWKAQGASFAELAENTDALLDEQGWLQKECDCLRRASHG